MNGVEFELATQFGMAGNQFAMADVVFIKGIAYQVNVYPIEVE